MTFFILVHCSMVPFDDTTLTMFGNRVSGIYTLKCSQFDDRRMVLGVDVVVFDLLSHGVDGQLELL